jgi:hypothetical protein
MTPTNKTTEQHADPLLMASNKPDLGALIREFQSISPNEGSSWNLQSNNDNVRYNRWAGQNPEGTKPDNEQSMPWPRASDLRVPLADEIINEEVAFWHVAFWRVLLNIDQAVGAAESNDLDSSGAFRKAIHWLVRNRLFASLIEESELYKQYKEHYGWAVLQIDWDRKIQNQNVTITMDELRGMAQQKPEMIQIIDAVLDPEREDEAVEYFQNLLDQYIVANITDVDLDQDDIPVVSEKRVRKAVRDLRKDNEMTVPMPYVAKNEPCVTALKPWEDIVLPPGCTDIQKAGRIYRIEWVTELDLKQRITTEGYNEEWVTAAVAHKGQAMKTQRRTVTGRTNAVATSSDARGVINEPDDKESIRILHAYQWTLDEDFVPQIHITTFHDAVQASTKTEMLYAKHQMLDYPHGKMPFSLGRREFTQRRISSSRGVPEMAQPFQRVEKVSLDAAIDTTSLTVLPPINLPSSGMDTDYQFGPGARNLTRRGQEPYFLDVPAQGVQFAYQLAEYMERRTARYFGRTHPDVDPTLVQVSQQKNVINDLVCWTGAFQQMFMLMMKFMPKSEFERITGVAPNWSTMPREISNTYDFIINFDVSELDSDKMTAKLKAIGEMVIPFDRGGSLDYNKIVSWALRVVDPACADLQKDQGAAREEMYRKVQSDIGLMAQGIEPVYDQGVNPSAQSELQFMQEIISKSTKLKEQFGTDPEFAKLVDNYAKNKEQSVAQQENKAIGRSGVKQVQQPQG